MKVDNNKKLLTVIALVLLHVLMTGEVVAKDRDMMEMMELVVLSQKFEECRKTKDDKTRLGCFDSLNEKIKVQMKIFQHALDFKVSKENWYELQMKNATAEGKETTETHRWREDFLTDLEKVMEKIEYYIE